MREEVRIRELAPDVLDCKQCGERVLTTRAASARKGLLDEVHQTLVRSTRMAWLACAALTGCTVLGLVELVSFLAVFRVRPPAGIVLLLATTAGLSALVGYEAVTLRRFVRSREHAHLLAALRAQKVCWAFLGLLGAVGLVLALVALLGGA